MIIIRAGCLKQSPTWGARNRKKISAAPSTERKAAISDMVKEYSNNKNGSRTTKFISTKTTKERPKTPLGNFLS